MAIPRNVKVRFTGLAGPPVVYDFSAVSRLVLRARPHYDALGQEHEMLDRTMKQDRYGFRVTVELVCAFTPGSAGDVLVGAVGSLVQNDDQLIEMTLDGDAATPTWRAGFFRIYQVLPITDKATGGSYWQLTSLFVCEQILEPDTVGSMAIPGQPGGYDVPFPTGVSSW